MLYKENQDLQAEMRNLRNYYDREKLISHNEKATRNFPSSFHKRKRRYQRSYRNSVTIKKQMMKKNMLIQKRKKQKNFMMTLMAIMMTLMTILMIMRMKNNFQKMIIIIMIMMKNTIKIKITKK